MNLPTGTITFLFTDIEGSTKLWERFPEAMRLALERHDTLLKAAIETHDGYIFKTVGDAFCAAFPTAPDALNAALEAHLALAAQEWGEVGPIRVRMGLHTGEAQERDNDYFGPTLNRVARLQGVGHGQQTLLSQTTHALVSGSVPPEAALSDLGMHRLKDLSEPVHVWQLLHSSLPQQFPALKSLDYLPTNLPQQLSSFIGREKEMAEIKARLEQTRLLTLTGSGGCGKTRLAVQVGAEVLEQYADGVWLVELADLSDAGLVPQTVADVLSIREAPGEPITKTLVSALKDRQMLLVLDNCEHLLEGSARLVDTLLKSCPKVRVLASSREALGIGGESAYRVPSLSVPPLPPAVRPHAGGSKGGASSLDKGRPGGVTPESVGAYESVRLFIERAMAAKSDFTLTHQNASVLASVCHHLDGIPLAIELAAARVRAMSLEQIESRLDSRFRLLTGGSRTALPRQQTLRALIDWSYDLLNEQEKALLDRLSVFSGGWTLEAAEFVCAERREVLDLLTSLVDKSLAVFEEREGKARYRLLETVRQYAQDRLAESGESAATRERHRDYFLELAELAAPKLGDSEQGEWLQRLEEEHENLRGALDWSLLEAGAGGGLRLCGALMMFWNTRGHLSEGREWCVRALGKTGSEEGTQERASALNTAGSLAFSQGDYASARTYHEECLAIRREIGDRKGIAASLHGLGNVAALQGDYASARAGYEASLTIRRQIGDQRGISAVLNGLGNVAFSQGDFASAQGYHIESLDIKREIGDRSGMATSLCNLGDTASSQSDYASARAYYAESLTVFREIGYRKGLANVLSGLGGVAYRQRDYASAHAYYEECLEIQRELVDRSSIAVSLNNLGSVALSQGDYASAWDYQQESLALFREIGYRWGIAYSLGNLGNVAYRQGDYATARTYDKECLDLQREIGNRSGIALSLNNLGSVAYHQGDYASARTYHEESLTLRREIGDRKGIASSLEACAGLAVKASLGAKAARLYGAAEALREEIDSRLPPNEQDQYNRNVEELRQALGEEAFSTAWASGRAMALEQAISYAQEATE